MLAAVAALLVVGKLWGTALSNQQLAEMLRLEEKTVELQAQLDDKSAELSRVALSAEVDMAALEKSRQEMIGLQQQIYQRYANAYRAGLIKSTNYNTSSTYIRADHPL